MKVYDAGDATSPGLYKSTPPTDSIGSADAAYADTATLAAGTEGYGLRITTTTAGTGNALEISYRYGHDIFFANTNSVGGFEITDVAIASTTAGVTDLKEVSARYKTAVSTTNVAGDYADTVTYTCTTTP